MARKQTKGIRIWLGSDTARILQLAQEKFGFAEGDEAALVLVALTNLMTGSVPATTTPLQHQEPEPEPQISEPEELELSLDDFLN